VLVDRSLKEQADPDGRWFGQWDAVFGAALAAGVVSEGQMEAFTREVFALSLEHRTVVRRGRAWRIDALASAVRAPPQGVQTEYELQRVRVGGQTVFLYERAHTRGTNLRHWSPRAAFRYVGRDRYAEPIDLPPGEYTVRATFLVWAVDPSGAEPKTAEVSLETLSRITVIDDDRELVRLATDDALRDRVRGAISARDATIDLSERSPYTWSAIDIRDPRIHLAFDVFLRAGERQWPVGWIGAGPEEYTMEMYGGREFPLDGFQPRESGTIDLILVPSARTAEERLARQTDTIWGETIILEAVPIEVRER
jgi:hypothetical protein